MEKALVPGQRAGANTVFLDRTPCGGIFPTQIALPPTGRSSQSPRFDLSTLRLRRTYRALANGTKSVVTAESLSGATRSSQRRAGISHKSISAGMVGSSVWSRGALLRLLACENVTADAIRVTTGTTRVIRTVLYGFDGAAAHYSSARDCRRADKDRALLSRWRLCRPN
jgi:hypothetical protein